MELKFSVVLLALAAMLSSAAAAQPEPGDDSRIDLSGEEPELVSSIPSKLDATPYQWRDGDRVRTVYLDTGLVVALPDAASPGLSGKAVATTSIGTFIRLEDDAQATVANGLVSVAGASRVDGDAVQPVFRSRGGTVMALPGGVLLVLEREWTEAQVSAFLSRNGIRRGDVSPLGEIPNGFVIPSGPGLASLERANELADQDGVVVSSPNWWTEIVAK